jgi:hypothetical protein
LLCGAFLLGGYLYNQRTGARANGDGAMPFQVPGGGW